MNALLFAPAFAFLHLLATGFSESVVNGLSFLLIQILLSLPFTLHDPHAYLSRSFELTRTFLYKWSTNWKFLSEETFLSSAFSRTLLLLHLVLLLFLALRWLNGMSPRELIARRRQPSADLILSTMFTCNLAGILCARSLHYQFFSWYAWTVPYLMSFADLEGAFRGLLGNRILAEFLANALRIAAFGLLEMTWLVFPATWWSSLVMGGVNGGLLLACLFFGRWQRPLGM